MEGTSFLFPEELGSSSFTDSPRPVPPPPSSAFLYLRSLSEDDEKFTDDSRIFLANPIRLTALPRIDRR